MPIVNMTTDPSRVPEDAVNVRDVSEAWKYSFSNPDTKLILWDSHVGLCVREYEVNMTDDSDFYMTVWDPIKKEPHDIMFATTRGWSYPCQASCVDASPEIMKEYQDWEEADYDRRKKEWDEIQRRKPSKGKWLRVVTGRKVPIGTEGHCFWVGKGYYGATRVGIKDKDGNVFWTDARNCEVVLPENEQIAS